MTADELFALVEANDKLEGIAIDAENGTVTVHSKPLNARYTINVDGIAHMTEAALLNILLHGNEQPLSYLTRVVGYFSRVENWNQSKIGELKDRHVGNYALPE